MTNVLITAHINLDSQTSRNFVTEVTLFEYVDKWDCYILTTFSSLWPPRCWMRVLFNSPERSPFDSNGEGAMSVWTREKLLWIPCDD